MRNTILVVLVLMLAACSKEKICEQVMQYVSWVGYDDNKIHLLNTPMDECSCIADCFERETAYKQHLLSIDTSNQAGKNEYKFYKNFPPSCQCK